MKRWIILTILMLVMIQVVYAIDEVADEKCGDTLTTGEDCVMLTPTLSCSNYTYDIYNSSGNTIRANHTLILLNNSIYYFTFNETEGSYIIKLCDDSTREIIVEPDADMELAMIIGLGIAAFLLVYIALNLSNDHNILKVLFIVFAVMLVLLIPTSLLKGQSVVGDNFFTSMLWIIRIFVVYIFIYFNWKYWFKDWAKGKEIIK